MLIEIQNKKRLEGNCWGITKYLSKKRISVGISEARNKDIGEYSSTLLHELLHVWIEIIKAQGAVINSRKEHAFIYDVEAKIADAVKVLKRRSK